MMRIVPPCSTIKSRPVPSLAVAKSKGFVSPATNIFNANIGGALEESAATHVDDASVIPRKKQKNYSLGSDVTGIWH